MGYNLGIGELEVSISDDGLKSIIDLSYKSEKHDNAPAFGEPTDFSNSRWPSYTSWLDAMKFCKLEDLFFNKETGLLRKHPGCFPLKIEHKQIIDNAYTDFYKKYPNTKAGYSPKINKKEEIFEDENWPDENDYATRLEWLKYWFDWAFQNCKQPVFYNS